MKTLILSLFILNTTSFIKVNAQDFTQNWTKNHVKKWSEVLAELKGKSDIKAIEIGSFEGRSSIWFIDNITQSENIHWEPSLFQITY